MGTRAEDLRLNEEDKRLLGVCGGIARFLGIPSAAVRIIYVVACLVWQPLIIAYFIAYWLLKDDSHPSRLKQRVSEKTDQLRNLDYRRPLYRNPDDAKIAGVCSGFADWFQVNPFIVRLLTFLSLFVFGPFTFWAYVVCWMVLQKRPEGVSRVHTVAGDYNSAETSARSLEDCGALLSRTEARLREVEAYMTSKQFSLHCEINRI